MFDSLNFFSYTANYEFIYSTSVFWLGTSALNSVDREIGFACNFPRKIPNLVMKLGITKTNMGTEID